MIDIAVVVPDLEIEEDVKDLEVVPGREEDEVVADPEIVDVIEVDRENDPALRIKTEVMTKMVEMVIITKEDDPDLDLVPVRDLDHVTEKREEDQDHGIVRSDPDLVKEEGVRDLAPEIEIEIVVVRNLRKKPLKFPEIMIKKKEVLKNHLKNQKVPLIKSTRPP